MWVEARAGVTISFENSDLIWRTDRKLAETPLSSSNYLANLLAMF